MLHKANVYGFLLLACFLHLFFSLSLCASFFPDDWCRSTIPPTPSEAAAVAVYVSSGDEMLFEWLLFMNGNQITFRGFYEWS